MTTGLTSTGFVAATTADVQTAIEADELSLIDPSLNLSPTQPLGQINGIFASATANIWALVAAIYAAIDPGGAVGVQLDALCAITGCTRRAASKTLVTCSVTLAAGTYAAGTLVANVTGYPQFTFVNRDAIVSPGGVNTGVVFLSTATGPIAVNATTLIVITTPVAGWTAITNPAAGTTGTNIETDTALRLRRASLLAASGSCTVDSIRAALLNVPGVLQANVIENNTNDFIPLLAQPAHSFTALIWDGPSPVALNDALAQAIWNSKPSGIQANGAQLGTAHDATGAPQTVQFVRVAQTPIAVDITIVTNLTFPSGGNTLVSSAIQAVLNAQGVGATVYLLAIESAALSVQGVLDVTGCTLNGVALNVPVDASHIATAGVITVHPPP